MRDLRALVQTWAQRPPTPLATIEEEVGILNATLVTEGILQCHKWPNAVPTAM